MKITQNYTFYVAVIIMQYILELEGTKIIFNAEEDEAEKVKRVVTELITKTGFVNLDIYDIVNVLDGAEDVWTGEYTASGRYKVNVAILIALKNTSGIIGAKSLIVSVVSGFETPLAEVSEVARMLELCCNDDENHINIVWGHVLDGTMEDEMRVSIIAIA